MEYICWPLVMIKINALKTGAAKAVNVDIEHLENIENSWRIW